MPQLVPRKQKVEQIRPPVHDPLAPKVKETSKLLPTTKSKVTQKQEEDSDSEEELSFASIVREKPSPSKVAMFLQECINEMVKDSDDETDSHLESSEYDTDR